ncbi:MAG: hypothetical protein JWN69_2486, partial [Alphaproteobacteria bacterium]|nr:hypothetical protein [Alphaproteobacteria bacterium]
PGLPGDLGSPNGGGVLVDLEGDLSGSTVHIADNTARANAIANSVSNSMTVSATRLEAESRFYLETVYDQNDLPVENAIVIDQTDFELDNDQDAGDDYFAYVQVEIFGSYGVTTYTDFAATDSKIEIKDNTQSVLALANAATNAVTLAATNIGGEESYGATSRLESDQDGDIEVDASSDLQLFAPLKGEGTSVAISGNTNAAYAGMNDVINTLKVGGTSISGGRFTTDAADVDGSDADHVLDNDQDSRGWIQSDATTTIVNNEIDMLIAEGTDFVVNLTGGSVAVNGNVTTAEVNANRAVNSVVLTGVASQTASAALRNRQDNDANVTATAATNATLSLNGGTGSEQSALVNGGIVLNGNVTEAIARGNNAINTMTVGTTGNNSVNATLAPLGGATASGPALMVNRQTNDNSVSATASATYRVILNADGVQAATGSTVAVTGNVVNAVAFGNRASNVLTLNAMPGGTTGGAVVSNQTNNGAITATASSVIFGVGIPSSGMQSAQTSVSGNQIAASAVGNAVTTTINIGR